MALVLGLGSVTALPASARAACVDLHATTLSVSPSNPAAGTDVDITFTVTNSGTCATPPEIFVQWRGDPADPDHWSGLRSLSDLSPGSTSEPQALRYRYAGAGTFASALVVDPDDAIEETDETNNASVVPVTVQRATTDLSVSDVRFEPARPVRGRPMTLIATIFNSGTTTAPSSVVSWLPAYNQASRLATAGPVAAGSSTTVRFTFTYPGYWTFDSSLTLDVNGQVPETDEVNNFHNFQIPVDPVGPDLVVQGLHLTPRNPQPGQAVTAAFVIRNEGNADAGPFQLRWQPSPASTPLLTVPAGGLAAGARRTLNIGYTFPATGASQGTATVDAQRQVAEIDEADNTIVVTVPVAPSRTNLTVVFDPTSATRTQGEPVTVKATVKNTGNTSSGPFAVDWDPDATGVLGAGHRTLTQHVDSLARGQSRVLTFTYRYLKAGSYSTVATVDAADRVVETSDTDNRFVVPLTVGSPDIDLEVTGFTLAAATPVESVMTTAAVTVKNTGRAAAGPFVVQWKLPASSAVSPRATVRGLRSGESRTLTFGGTFVDAGSARTSAVVDVFHQVKEPGGEGNNTAARTVTVTPGSR